MNKEYQTNARFSMIFIYMIFVFNGIIMLDVTECFCDGHKNPYSASGKT